MQDPAVSPVPVMLKHPILARIDAISGDRQKVAALRDLLLSGADAEALAAVAVRHDVVTRELAEEMLRTWANVGGSGWLGDILAELRRGVLEAADLLLAEPWTLSSWWILGLTDDFRIVVQPAGDRLLLFMTTPPLPPAQRFAKLAPMTLDPSFRPALQLIRDHLDAMLAPPAA
jgi:hypothetical protein